MRPAALLFLVTSLIWSEGALAQTPRSEPAGDESKAVPTATPDDTATTPHQREERIEVLERQVAELRRAAAEHSDTAPKRPHEAIAEEAVTEEDAALEALLEEDTDLSAYERGDTLKFYGFMDVGFQRLFLPKGSFLHGFADSRASSFVLGNINLFADAQPDEAWRGVFEIRYTPLPNGVDRSFESSAGTEYEREDTREFDLTTVNGQNRIPLSSLVIERAWIQFTESNAFQLRVGQWFTPYGIWNIDHGTPTLISLLLPGSQNSEFFPQRQTGVQALGSTYSGHWELGYRAYVSNGRSYTLKDLSDDKAVGGRLFARDEGQGAQVTVGVSGHYGTLTDESKRIVSVSPFTLAVEEVVAGKEWALGLDVSLDAGPLRVRSEFVLNRTDYETGKRPSTSDFTSAPDAYRWDAYTVAAYRLPWAGLEPYGWMEVMHGPSSIGDTIFVPSLGVNVYFSPNAQLKTQYASTLFRNLSTTGSASRHDFQVFTSRLVLAF